MYVVVHTPAVVHHTRYILVSYRYNVSLRDVPGGVAQDLIIIITSMLLNVLPSMYRTVLLL